MWSCESEDQRTRTVADVGSARQFQNRSMAMQCELPVRPDSLVAPTRVARRQRSSHLHPTGLHNLSLATGAAQQLWQARSKRHKPDLPGRNFGKRRPSARSIESGHSCLDHPLRRRGHRAGTRQTKRSRVVGLQETGTSNSNSYVAGRRVCNRFRHWLHLHNLDGNHRGNGSDGLHSENSACVRAKHEHSKRCCGIPARIRHSIRCNPRNC